MKKNDGSLRLNADTLFPWLLLLTLISILTLTWYHFEFINNLNQSRFHKLLPTINYLTIGAILWTISTLGMRLWFAWHYRPYTPLPDDQLPVITVIIPAYNEGRQILESVRSVMSSDYPAEKMQVICIDDGSKDDTLKWMKTAKREFPHRMNLVRQPFNSGKRLALREGFTNAKGVVYVTIDSDSEILPDTLRHLVSPFVHDQRVGAVAGNVRVLNTSEGYIPKMLEVSFTCSFDFLRAGQSVYGGVFCTPGALSAYRAEVVQPHLTDWINQTFMGKRATIGEDRALTNLVLSLGYRVVYQRKAVVKTKIPVVYKGLRKMMLRWARSNIRENLVMFSFITRRFRSKDSGSGWLRLFSITQISRLTLGEAAKFALIAQLFLNPALTLFYVTIGCIISSLLPSLVYQRRYGSWFGWQWSIPFSFFWLLTLSWIPFWGLVTANRTGWLTREIETAVNPQNHVREYRHSRTKKIFSKAA
jgi:hyaluronan synthase